MKKFSIVYIDDNKNVFHIVIEENDSLKCVKNYLINVGSSKQYSHNTYLSLLKEFNTLKELCRYITDINEYINVIEV